MVLSEKNFGYGTKDHMKSLLKYGINRHHRIKFKRYNILFKNQTLKRFFFVNSLTLDSI